MAQEIEIEYKVLLSEQQFKQLASELPFPAKPITQINYYFETVDFKLKSVKSALRIRKKQDRYVLTLKEPFENAILETHDFLSEAEFEQWINRQPCAKQHTSKQLKQLGVTVDELVYYGALQTDRKTYIVDDVTYVLDKSYYNNIIDYELEIEAMTHDIGKKAIDQLINQFNLSAINQTTKIERFFTTRNS